MPLLPYKDTIRFYRYQRTGFSTVPSAAEYQSRLKRYARDVDQYLVFFKDQFNYDDLRKLPNKLLDALVEAKKERLEEQKKQIEKEQKEQERHFARQQIMR